MCVCNLYPHPKLSLGLVPYVFTVEYIRRCSTYVGKWYLDNLYEYAVFTRLYFCDREALLSDYTRQSYHGAAVSDCTKGSGLQ